MASKLEIEITWQNNNFFKAKAKQTDGGPPLDWKKIVEAEENGHLTVIWPSIAGAVIMFMQAKLEEIGKLMKE